MTAQLEAMARVFEWQLGCIAQRRSALHASGPTAGMRSPDARTADQPDNPATSAPHVADPLIHVGPAPASAFTALPGQRELLAALEASPDASLAYQEKVALGLSGQVDATALARAWHLVQSRHESLRLRVTPKSDITLADALEDLRVIEAGASVASASAAVLDSMSRPLDLHDSPLVRAELYRLGYESSVLILTAHHLIADGWSIGLLLAEWADAYNKLRIHADPALPEPAQWRTFATWVSSLARASDGSPSMSAVPHSAPPPLVLPQSRAMRGFEGSRIHVRDPETHWYGSGSTAQAPGSSVTSSRMGLMEAARRCGRTLQVSPSTVLLSAYAVFLGRLSSQTRLGIGVPIAGHGLAGLPVMVAMASAVMPLDIELDPAMTFRQAVEVVHFELTQRRQEAALLFAPEHAEGFPVTALFNIDPGVQLGLDGVDIHPEPLPLTRVKTGMFFNLLEFNGTVLLDFDCHTDLAGPSRARHWLDGLLHLAGHACSQPDQRLAALSMGPLEARPTDASLRLVDAFGGAAAACVPARLMRVDAAGLAADTGLTAYADENGVLEVLGNQGRYVRAQQGWGNLDAIDEALAACEGVADAATLMAGDDILAFVHPHAGMVPDMSAIHRRLRANGDLALVPTAYALVPEPTRDDAGAVREEFLHSHEWPRAKLQLGVAPRDELERRVAQIWQEVLGLKEAPGVTDDFFASGGHSLKAVVLANRVAELERCAFRLADFFRKPTIAHLAQMLRHAAQVQPIPVAVAALRGQLSDAQKRMWLLEQLEDDRSAYNMGFMLRRDKPIDAAALRGALQALTDRHESLRSAFAESQGALRVVAPPELVPRLDIQDLRAQDLAGATLEVLALQFVNAKFDLATPPLWRCLLVRREQGDALIVSMHHSIGDNWSITVWLRDFLVLLDAAENASHDQHALPVLPIQYADFAAWHNLRTEDAAAALGFWRTELADLPAKLLMPSCRPRTAESMADVSGHTIVRRLSPAVHSAFMHLCRERGVSSFTALTAAFRLWLWGTTGCRDAVLGTVHAGRDHPALADQIGLFVNTIPLRLPLDPAASFLSLLDEVRQRAVTAFDHSEVPFNQIVEQPQLPRQAEGNPLFEVLVTHDDLQDFDAGLRRTGWRVSEVDLPVSPFELILTGCEDADGMELRLQYRSALWDAERIALWLEDLESLLARVCRDPHRVLASLAQSDDLLPPEANTSVVEHFEKWRRLQPKAPAVLGDTVRSYEDVGAASDALCARLMASATPCSGEVVAVLVDRSWDLPVAVLAVMKARATFVLLDPSHPPERLAFIAADAGCRHIVHSDTYAGLAESLHALTSDMPAGQGAGSRCERAPLQVLPVHDPKCLVTCAAGNSRPRRDDLAYLIYTSGSTGEPKGVLVDHAALSDHLEAATPLYQWTASDRSLLFATVAVDAVIEQLLLPLVNGASFCILDAERFSPQAYVETWRRWDATIIDVPPVFWGELINWCSQHPDAIRGLAIKTLMTGGEEMTPQRVAGWYGLPLFCGQTLNLFGPTETTCSPVVARVAPHHASADRIPIGFPVGSRHIRIVGAAGADVAHGDDGELWIGGTSVARGYLNKPSLTAERFVTDGQSIRWYRTGDRVRQRADGELEFLGRMDRQFKLRGFRIEPGEIEDALRRCEGIQDAAVTMEQDGEAAELQAWLVRSPGATPTRSGILRQLRAELPAHMIPKRLRCISHLPLSRTEKLDRAALAGMPGEDLWDTADTVNGQATGPLDAFCSLIAMVVGIPKVTGTDNFFEVGGHSLKAIEVVARVREQFGVDIRVKDVFTASTVADLFDTVQAAAKTVVRRITPVPRDQWLPASAGQSRLWLLQSKDPKSVAFNMVAGFLIDGPLDVAALQSAYCGLLSRHEVLRTRLIMRRGQLIQELMQLADVPPIETASSPSGYAAVSSLEAIFYEELKRPFSLDAEAPIRMRLLLAADGAGLVINVHHAAFDGWSASVLLNDLAALYRTACQGQAGRELAAQGTTSDGSLKPLAIQYADYAYWQQTLIPESHRAFWLSQLDGEALPELHLPTDKPRPEVSSGRGAMVPRSFNQSDARRLKALAAHEGLTLFGVMLALTASQLYVRSGQTDFIIGTAVAGRDSPELEDQIGFYVNMLPLRCRVSLELSFRQWVNELSQVASEALLHQDYPFDSLVYELDPKRSAGRQPLFDVVLNMQNFKPLELLLQGTTSRLLQDRSVSSKYDLMYMVDDVDSLDLYLEYATDLFDPSTAAGMADEFLAIGAAASRSPDTRLQDLLEPWRKTLNKPQATGELTTLKDDQW